MRLTTFLLLATLCRAATVTVCSSGCTTTSLQTALNTTAACGDTIQIASAQPQSGNFTITYRGCGSNPITVTSDRAAWLPPAGGRVTPSQLGNMAQITTPNSSPALAAALDGMNRPPAGWKFIGIAFTSSSAGPTYSLVDLNPYQATSSAETPDNITFDRCYFYRASVYVGGDVQNMVRGDASNLTIKNSFFGDGFYNGVESHGISVLTTPGPVTATNNFITTSSIPIFTGGAVPSYPTYIANGVTAQYNYFWRPWKWNSDPLSPYEADYVAAAGSNVQSGPYSITGITSGGIITVPAVPYIWDISILTISGVGGCTVANASGWRINPLTSTTFQLLNFPGCNSTYTSGGSLTSYAISVAKKNLGEFKWAGSLTLEYNVGENSWYVDNYQGQWNGFTGTIRTDYDSTINNAALTSFSFTDASHITWAGTYRIGGSGALSTNTSDLGICISYTTYGTECRPVASFSGASLVTTTPFSGSPAGSFTGWITYDASAQLTNVAVTHNVWKNVDQWFTVLAFSPANGVGSAGFGKTFAVSQNLFFSNDSGYTTNNRGTTWQASSSDSANPSAYTMDHNTFYNPNGIAGSFFYAVDSGCPTNCGTSGQPTFDSSAVTNNLFGTSAAGGNGAFAGDSTVSTTTTALEYFSNSNIKNNALPGGTNGSASGGGNTVSGNIYTAWSDPFGGLGPTNPVVSGGPYYHTGTDGASLGADTTQLPLVNNVAVAANVLGFDVTSGINSDVKATQPCALEVSSSRNLASDLGTYSVIASLDPTVTMGADLSTRSDVTLVGAHVTWPLNGVVTGTTYYGRLMCYGDTEQFTFTAITLPQTGGISSSRSLVSGKALVP